MSRVYNRLEGEIREWARNNRFNTSERCVRVKEPNKHAFSPIEFVAGNGTLGFSTRRGEGEDYDLCMVKGLEGQWKSGRGTACRKRKNVSRLATLEQFRRMMMDDYELAQEAAKLDAIRQDKAKTADQLKRELRKKNRNPKARRGQS